MIVADTNLIVYLFVDLPQSRAARAWAQADPEWVTPPLWRYEFTGAMLDALKAGQFLPEEAHRILRSANELLTPNERQVDQSRVLDVSLRLRVSPCDANFLVLAETLGVRCVTNDRQMLERAPRLTRELSRLPE